MKILVALFMLIQVAHGFSYPRKPKTKGHICTPSDKDFIGFRYKSKMAYCKRNVSLGLRKSMYRKYKVRWNSREHYTLDHIVMLSVGGSNHPDNLWPEHLSIKCKRAGLEYQLYLKVKDGVLTPYEAQQIILKSKKVIRR